MAIRSTNFTGKAISLIRVLLYEAYLLSSLIGSGCGWPENGINIRLWTLQMLHTFSGIVVRVTVNGSLSILFK